MPLLCLAGKACGVEPRSGAPPPVIFCGPTLPARDFLPVLCMVFQSLFSYIITPFLINKSSLQVEAMASGHR